MTEICSMFTGIVEAIGQVIRVETSGTNKTFWIKSPISSEFKIDQSVAHDGVCLTVESIMDECHKITAIKETLEKTTLNLWTEGSQVNIERSLLLSSRLDGHFVQGHVDTIGVCKFIKDENGSWEVTFGFPDEFSSLVIEKGSICINGISLTVFGVDSSVFKVGIIPYTWEHTNFSNMMPNKSVNLEFDVIGKYILKKLSLY